jgi:hypothetical protein
MILNEKADTKPSLPKRKRAFKEDEEGLLMFQLFGEVRGDVWGSVKKARCHAYVLKILNSQEFGFVKERHTASSAFEAGGIRKERDS